MADFDPNRPYTRRAAPASSGFDPSRPFTARAPLDRSMGERFLDNLGDGFLRGPMQAYQRLDNPSGTPRASMGAISEMGIARGIAGTILGREVDTPTGAADQERQRRQNYDARAAADPVRNVGDGLAAFTGQLGGAAPDPTSWIGGGGSYVGRQGVGQIALQAGRNAAGQGAANAAADVVAQGLDVASGTQDGYNAGQTAAAGAFGAVLSGAADGALPAGRAAARGVRQGFDYTRWAAERTGQAIGSRAANPVPGFDGPAMDARPVALTTTVGPVPLARLPRTPRAASGAPAPAPAVAFAPPVQGEVSSGFGPRRRPNARASANHQGIDYAVPNGTPVAASADGEVIFAGPRGNYGNRVVIRHADGSETSYSHLSGFDVRQGDRVRAGQTVARSGSTGNVTGPHLHFEVRRGGGYIDPRAALSGEAAPAGMATASLDASGDAPRRPYEPIRASQPEAGPIGQTPDAAPSVARRYPSARPEVIDLARQAAADPAAVPALRAALTEDLGSSRAARSAARGMIFEARREALAAPAAPRDALAVDNPARSNAPAVSEGFDLAKPFTVRTESADPVRLAARAGADARAVDPSALPAAQGFDLAQPFTIRDGKPETLAVDMSGYQGRIGQGQAAQTVQSGGQSVNGMRQAPRPGAVARQDAPAFSGKTVSQLAGDLRQVLGLTHRQGRVGAKQALGTYNTASGVVRTKAVQELDVLAHEATHALEFERKGPALAAALRANATDLEALAYPGAAAGVKREEGFAEFGRWYLTNPDHAKRIAPRFYDAFEAAMQADAPEVLAGMKAIQKGYRNVLDSASIEVAKASIAYTGSRGPIRNLIDEVKRNGPGSALRRVVDDLYTAVIDDLHPLSVAERELGKIYLANSGQKMELKRAQSPYALSRLSREAYAAGHGDLMNGVTPYQGLDAEGPGLADALETAGLDKGLTGKLKPDTTREFDAYLIARRMVHEWDAYSRGDLPNPPDRNTKQFHEQVIADADAAHPTWAQAAGQVYEFLNNLWRKEFEAGLITQEAYQRGMTAHPDYVPLMRDMSDKGPGGKQGKPRGAMQFAGGVKAFEGSSRDIISPLSSIMRRAYELNAIVKRNDVMIALDDLAQAAGRGAGSIVERLPANQIEAFTVSAADALTKTAEEMGVSGRDLSTMQKLADDAASDSATITLFKQSEFSPRKGEAVVFVWRGGKKTPLLLADGEFGQQMFQALAGMNKDLRNIVVDSMAGATQILRYGVTLSPEFMAANIIRDAMAVWINTDVGFIPGLDTVRGGAMEIAQAQTAKRYATAGGMRGGANTAATAKPFPKTDAEAEAQLQHLRRKGWKVKRFASWRGFAELTDLSETSTRLSVFERAFKKAKREGLTDYEALVESGFTSRDYLDFARRGSKMLTASRIVTFLNAALQGLDKSSRVLSAGGNLKALLTPLSKEARTPAERAALGHAYRAWAKISALGAFGLGLRMLYQDDPEYEEINDRLRATHWVARIGGKWVFVPKPFELATVSNIMERGFEGTVLKDPKAGERLLSDFRHTIAPPSEIPALSVPFAIGKNRDYLGRPIVPDHLLGAVDPELQYNSYTSDLGKLVGKTFNLSPAQVDYVFTGIGGSLGRYVLQGSNVVGEAITGRPRTASGPEDTFLTRRFVRSISRGSQSQSEFWDQISKDGGEMTRAEGSFRALMRDAHDEEAAAYLAKLPADRRAYVIAKVFAGEGQSIVHPLVRTQNTISAVGDVRTSMREGTLRDSQGMIIPLTPDQRRAIDNALGDFALAEMRNSLISAGVEGWTQRDRMDPRTALERVGRTSPAVFEQLAVQLQQAKGISAVHPEVQGQAEAMWQQVRPMLEAAPDQAMVVALARQKRASTGSRANRYQEAQRQAGGAYAPPPVRTPRNALAQ